MNISDLQRSETHTQGFIMYQRVIPRDLFNESKLLKCLGRLCLMIHEGQTGRLTFEHEGSFEIDQNIDSGGLTCVNLHFFLGGTPIYFESSYNSKDNYPLWFIVEWEYKRVFNEDGAFTDEFASLIGAT